METEYECLPQGLADRLQPVLARAAAIDCSSLTITHHYVAGFTAVIRYAQLPVDGTWSMTSFGFEDLMGHMERFIEGLPRIVRVRV